MGNGNNHMSPENFNLRSSKGGLPSFHEFIGLGFARLSVHEALECEN